MGTHAANGATLLAMGDAADGCSQPAAPGGDSVDPSRHAAVINDFKAQFTMAMRRPETTQE